MADGQGFARIMCSIMKPVEMDTVLQTSPEAVSAITTTTATSINANKTEQVSSDNYNGDIIVTLRILALAVHAQIEFALGVLVHLLLVLWYSFMVLVRVAFFSHRSFRTHYSRADKKRIAWTEAMTMSDIETIRAAYSKFTLNDVMLACMERSFTT
jgi:hypothetical protein